MEINAERAFRDLYCMPLQLGTFLPHMLKISAKMCHERKSLGTFSTSLVGSLWKSPSSKGVTSEWSGVMYRNHPNFRPTQVRFHMV